MAGNAHENGGLIATELNGGKKQIHPILGALKMGTCPNAQIWGWMQQVKSLHFSRLGCL